MYGVQAGRDIQVFEYTRVEEGDFRGDFGTSANVVWQLARAGVTRKLRENGGWECASFRQSGFAEVCMEEAVTGGASLGVLARIFPIPSRKKV